MAVNDLIRRVLRRWPGSIRELAREAGVDNSLLSKLARGERSVSHAVASKLSAALSRRARKAERDAAALQELAERLRDEVKR